MIRKVFSALLRHCGPASAGPVLAAVAAAGLTAMAAPLLIRDVDGHSWTMLAPAAHQFDLLFFISSDCPISNRYVPEIQRICSDYASKGVRCFAVYADSPEERMVRRHRLEYGFRAAIPAIVDRDRTLVRAAGPHVTPEAALYSSAGRVYRGRIDDLYVDVGRTRRAPTRHDLRIALDAAIAGRTIVPADTTAIGCFIQTP